MRILKYLILSVVLISSQMVNAETIILDLEKTKSMVCAGNPELSAAQNRIAVAKARVTQRRSGYLPDLYGRASYQRSDWESDSVDILFKEKRVGLGVSWEIFDGLEREFAVLAAKKDQISAEESRNETQRLLRKYASVAFFSALRAYTDLQVREMDFQDNSALLQKTMDLESSGLASKVDVNNFRVRMNRVKLDILDAQYELDVAEIIIAELTGNPEAFRGAEIVYRNNDTSVELPSLAGLLKLAEENRPTLRKLLADVESIDARRKAVRGSLLPSVTAFGEMSQEEGGVYTQDEWTDHSMYGVGVNWNFFSGGETWATIKEFRSLTNARRDELQLEKNAVASEVMQTLRLLELELNRYPVLKENAAYNEEIYQSTLEAFEIGKVTITRLNQILTDLSLSRRQLKESEIAMKHFKDMLDAACGVN